MCRFITFNVTDIQGKSPIQLAGVLTPRVLVSVRALKHQLPRCDRLQRLSPNYATAAQPPSPQTRIGCKRPPAPPPPPTPALSSFLKALPNPRTWGTGRRDTAPFRCLTARESCHQSRRAGGEAGGRAEERAEERAPPQGAGVEPASRRLSPLRAAARGWELAGTITAVIHGTAGDAPPAGASLAGCAPTSAGQEEEEEEAERGPEQPRLTRAAGRRGCPPPPGTTKARPPLFRMTTEPCARRSDWQPRAPTGSRSIASPRRKAGGRDALAPPPPRSAALQTRLRWLFESRRAWPREHARLVDWLRGRPMAAAVSRWGGVSAWRYGCARRAGAGRCSAEAPSRSETWPLPGNARWRGQRDALVRSQPDGMTSCDRGPVLTTASWRKLTGRHEHLSARSSSVAGPGGRSRITAPHLTEERPLRELPAACPLAREETLRGDSALARWSLTGVQEQPGRTQAAFPRAPCAKGAALLPDLALICLKI